MQLKSLRVFIVNTLILRIYRKTIYFELLEAIRAEMKSVSDLLGVTRVWIIEKHSGITLYCYEPMSKIPGSLFGALLTAIRQMMSEIQIGQLSSISTDTHNLIITVSEHIISAIILEKGFSTECLYPILIQINNESEQMYLKMVERHGIVDTDFFSPLDKFLFEEFNSHIEHLAGHCEDFPEQVQPKKKDDAGKKLEDSGLW